VLQYVFFGLMTGSTLAVAAAGFAMIRQTEGFLNIAHGQYLMLGALLGYVFTSEFGLNVFLAGAISVLLVGLVGTIAAWLVFFPLRGKGLLAQFFTSIGLAFVLYGVIRASWSGSAVKVYEVDFGAVLDLGPVSVTPGEIGVIGIAWAAVLALHLFLTRSRVGWWIRAVASNGTLARLRGVQPDWVMSAVWFIASALAALSGVLIGVLGSIHTELGWHYILIVLAVSVLGGVRNLYGVMAAGLLLGLIVDLSGLVIPSKYGTVVAFGIIILTLLLRPEGLFSVQRRREAGT
jgi:neutral amino acid transport system permease protein